MATDFNLTITVKNRTTGVTSNASNTYTGGDYEDSGILQVTTSEVTQTISTDLTNVAGIFVVNRDASNFVQMGYATATYVHKISAGMPAFIPLTPGETTLYWAADTATCAVEYRIIEAP